MLSMIVAASQNNVIGKDNVMPWHLSEDLKHFKSLTTNHTIIMGRKTFESLGRPLPNRKHIVLTRNQNWSNDDITIIHDSADILKMNQKMPTEEFFVIGGAEIYKIMLPHISKIYLTRIFENFEGDAFLPEINWNDFNIEEKTEIRTSQKSNLKYQFQTYKSKLKN